MRRAIYGQVGFKIKLSTRNLKSDGLFGLQASGSGPRIHWLQSCDLPQQPLNRLTSLCSHNTKLVSFSSPSAYRLSLSFYSKSFPTPPACTRRVLSPSLSAINTRLGKLWRLFGFLGFCPASVLLGVSHPGNPLTSAWDSDPVDVALQPSSRLRAAKGY